MRARNPTNSTNDKSAAIARALAIALAPSWLACASVPSPTAAAIVPSPVAEATVAIDIAPPAEATEDVPAQTTPGAPAPAAVEHFVERALPAAWETSSTRAFERALDAWAGPAERLQLAPADLATLIEALDRDDPVGMRAALLLARSLDPRAGEALLQHLERRIAAGEFDEHLDAPDVIAAAAFGHGAQAKDRETRLVRLSIGKHTHPDFEVRVECAISALALGRDQVIPFLVQVLRERTTLRDTKPTNWIRKDDLDWSQWRAGQALAERAGTTALFDPNASMQARLREAARLEQLCLPFVPKPPQ